MGIQVGSEVAGYRIDGLLGRGGMGMVYVAEHLLLGRKAALKTLLVELASDSDFKTRFIRESQMVAAIDHPNIIPIYDAGEIEGTAYIAMRFVPGRDLDVMIKQQRQLSAHEALSILDQAGAALDAAHVRGLVHRDIKPANILIEEGTDRIYLTDFGIAKEAGTSGGLTQPGFFLGTVDYAAPEQIEGQEIGPPADLYAFGCVLFECLAGRKPFVGATDIAVIKSHVLDPPPSLTELRPDLPAAIDAVITRALAKMEADRYGSCRELIEAAQMALGASGGAAAPPAPAAPAASAAPFDSVAAAPLATATAAAPEAALPTSATAIVGRERELADVIALIHNSTSRLVTLTGLGGTGKTRLAVAAAATVASEFDLVAFIDLAPVQDPGFVPSAVAQALGARESANQSALEAVRDRLGGRSALLVLDNFEQVLAAAPFVAELLEAIPSARVLVTSQGTLRLRGEREYAVPPLSLPDADDVSDLDALRASPAIGLFVERAQESRADFELNEENAEAVVEICRRLDGIPLAIELAAARVKLLPPQALRSRLQRRLELLTGGSAGLPERQRTLRGAIDWSYDLLTETEQAVMTRLGAFVGGCSLEAAEGVCGEPFGLGIGGMVDTLASLVDKSLVRQSEGADGEPRFGMLETIREYAGERLEGRGEAEQVRRLHTGRFLDLVEAAEPELTRSNQAAWLQRLDDENGNIRAALAWSLEAGEVDLALRFAGALVRYWSIRGYMLEGRDWLREAIERGAATPPGVQAKAAFAAGYADLGLGSFGDAERWFQRSLELARTAAEPGAEAAALAQLAWVAMTRTSDGEGEARSLAERAVALGREVDDKRTTSGALNTLAELAMQRGDPGGALEMFEESLALRRGLGDRRLVANSLVTLGRARVADEETVEATRLLDEALALARELRDTWGESVALGALGKVRLLEGAPDEAAELFRAALRLAVARGDRRAAADAMLGIAAAVAAESGDIAAHLYGASQGLLEATKSVPSPAERVIERRLVPTLTESLGGDALASTLTKGRGLDFEAAVALALPGDARRPTTAAARA
ncbi:MAG TPA: protein kinase [Gaiellaceae bacterium]